MEGREDKTGEREEWGRKTKIENGEEERRRKIKEKGKREKSTR